MRCSTLQFLFLVLVVGLVLMRESRTAPFDSVEATFSSWLCTNAPRESETAPLALVQISDEELGAKPWPWTPEDYSLFLFAALPFQPPVLAVEPVLAWKKPNPQQMTMLHNQELRAPALLLASELGFPEDPALMPPFQEVPVLRHIEGSVSALREYPLVALQPSEELRLGATIGFVDPHPDESKVIRRVPLVFRYCGLVVPSFALQAAMLWFGVTAEEVMVSPGSFIALGKEIRVPVDEAGMMPVDFTIPMVRFPLRDLTLSAEQTQAGHSTSAPVARLKNSLTLLARTDTASRTLRLANGRNGSRGELLAATIATLQQGRFVEPAGLVVEAILLLEALILAWFCRRMTRLGTTVLCIGLFAVYLLVSLGACAAWQVAFPLTLPAGLLAFLVLFRQLDPH